MPPKKKGVLAPSASKVVASGKNNKMPTRDERADALLARVGKEMRGRVQLKAASDYHLPYLTKRLPSGLLTLDLALRGGFPAGGLSQIVGPKNSGKTWLTWQVIRQQQFYHGNKLKVLLAMTEMRADRGQARLAGVKIAMGDEDIELMDRARSANGKPAFTAAELGELRTQVGEIHEAHGFSAEDLYDVVLAGVEDNVYHVIVIDSFGSIMSGAEAESESLNEKQYSGASAVNTKFLRKLAALLCFDDSYDQTRDVCILGINQVRDAIGDKYKEYKSPGGRALEHAKFVDLLVESGKSLGTFENQYWTDGSEKKWVRSGKEVNWKIEKGKAGIHEGATGTYNYSFSSNSADFYLDTLVAGVQCGVVEQAGSYLGIPDPENPGQFLGRAQGKDAFIKLLSDDAFKKAAAGQNDESLLNIIRSEAFLRSKIDVNYTWDS